jgi:TRAP-type C4-dicarboxylate transport system substrate-binding protein
MKKIILVCIILALITALVISGCGQTPAGSTSAVKTVTLKASFDKPPTHSAVVHAHEAFDSMETLTDGRVKVDIYDSATLVKPPDIWDAINRGIADFSSMPLPAFQSGLPWWGAEMLPGGLKDYQGMHNAAVNGMLTMYQDAFHAKGMKITISYLFCPGLAYIMTKNKRVAVPEDLKGLKIQAAGPTEANMIQALGAAPVVMAFPDVYEGLMTDLIDGTMGNISSFTQYKVQEPSNYLCMYPFGGPYVAPLVSEVGLAKLTPGDQAIFLEQAKKYGMLEETGFATGSERMFSDVLVPNLKEIVYPTPDQTKLWNDALAPMISDWKAKAGAEGQKALDIIHQYN